MLILVGADKCGKTTLAEELVNKLLPGWGYKHHGVPPVDPYSYFGWFLSYARSDVIVDRLHPCEVAYGLTYRGESKLSKHEERLLNLAAMAQGARVIWLYDDVEAIENRWDVGEPFDVARVGTLQDHYDGVMKASPLKWYKHKLTDLIDLKTKAPTPTLKLILEEEKGIIDWVSTIPAPNVGWGNIEPGGFIVVGQAPSFFKKEGELKPRGPFCWGFSGDFLWDKLDEAKINWTKGYYTNANAHTIATFNELIFSVQPRLLVSLGEDAKKLISSIPREWGVEMLELTHPSHERRFNLNTPSAGWDDLSKTMLGQFK